MTVRNRKPQSSPALSSLLQVNVHDVWHYPPRQVGPWVIDDEQRTPRFGADVGRGLCDRDPAV